MLRYAVNGEHALASALRETADVEEPAATLAAAQIGAVLRTLATRNARRLIEGQRCGRLYRTALTEAEHAFELRRTGLGERA